MRSGSGIVALFLRWRLSAISRLHRAVGRFFAGRGLVVLSERRLAALQHQRRALLNLAVDGTTSASTKGVECVVFSKDRPMQLHALLSSYYAMAADAVPVHVLYRASDARYESAYRQVERIFLARGVRFVPQTNFRENVLEMLDGLRTDKVMFLVDDILFVEPFRFADLASWDSARYIPSLRLGKNLSYCYTVQRRQRLPQFLNESTGDAMIWRWAEGEHDWGYPMSLDGHVFSLDEIRVMALASEFSSPNTLEVALTDFNDCVSDRLGVCYAKSRIVNVPSNRVQNDNDNIHMGVDPRYLLEQWEAGYQLDYERLFGMSNTAAHEEIVLPLVRRSATTQRAGAA